MAGKHQSDSEFLDRRLSLIAQATGTPIGTQTPEQLAEKVVDLLREGFETDAAVARWLDDERLHLLASRGIPGPKLQDSMPANIGLSAEMFSTGRGVLINDVADHPLTTVAYHRDPASSRFRSFCGVPLVVGGRPVGVLGIFDIMHTHAYAERDLEHLQIVGNHIAAAIDNTRLYDELQRANARLEARAERTTEELRTSESRFRLLAENAIDIISQHTPDGRVAYISPAVTTVLGWEPDEIVGRLPREFVHPDDRDTVISARPELMAAQGRPVQRIFRFRTQEGGYRWVESVSQRKPVTGDRGDEPFVVVTRDVSRRRAAEQRLRLAQAAIAEVGEAVVITDAQLDLPGPRIVYVNPAFSEMTGYSAQEIEGQTPRVLQGEQTHRETLDRLRATLGRGEPFTGETVNYRKDGTPFHVEWNIAPVRQVDGTVTHWVSVQRDITQRLHDEQMAQVHRDALAHDARLTTMGELASGLAHELNQPLTVIANYANGALMRIDRAGEADDMTWTREVLRRVSAQATRAGEIIRRLRAFIGRRAGSMTEVSLNEVMQEVIEFNELDTRASGVRIETVPADNLPATTIDRIQIQQVVLNLLRNAIEAVEDQPTERKWVRLRTASGGPGTVVLTVQDAGHGLTTEQRRRLFEPFFTTKAEGMGLGLTISHSIVEAHGGRLWAKENQGQGLTMCLELPIKSAK